MHNPHTFRPDYILIRAFKHWLPENPICGTPRNELLTPLIQSNSTSQGAIVTFGIENDYSRKKLREAIALGSETNPANWWPAWLDARSVHGFNKGAGHLKYHVLFEHTPKGHQDALHWYQVLDAFQFRGFEIAANLIGHEPEHCLTDHA